MSDTVAFDEWFTETFGYPQNSQQEMVKQCCFHAWMASRRSRTEAAEVKNVLLKAVDDWEAKQKGFEVTR